MQSGSAQLRQSREIAKFFSREPVAKRSRDNYVCVATAGTKGQFTYDVDELKAMPTYEPASDSGDDVRPPAAPLRAYRFTSAGSKAAEIEDGVPRGTKPGRGENFFHTMASVSAESPFKEAETAACFDKPAAAPNTWRGPSASCAGWQPLGLAFTSTVNMQLPVPCS